MIVGAETWLSSRLGGYRLRSQVGVRGLVDNVLPLAFAVLVAMLVFSVQGGQHPHFI